MYLIDEAREGRSSFSTLDQDTGKTTGALRGLGTSPRHHSRGGLVTQERPCHIGPSASAAWHPGQGAGVAGYVCTCKACCTVVVMAVEWCGVVWCVWAEGV